MRRLFYKGIDFNSYNKNKGIKKYNVEIVKQDLLNHIFTRRGERVMMPKFGTVIPDLIMEPLDQVSVEAVREDLVNVFNYDPRVILQDLIVRPIFEENAIVAIADLFYLELNFNGLFDIRLDFNT